MLTIAIVDDAPEAIETLGGDIEKYCSERGLECKICKFGSPLKFLAEYKPVYDIIFLDIAMPIMSGMELASYIRKADSEVSLVFVTNMIKYALRGYDVGADDFIVKPVRYGSLCMKLDRILKKHTKSTVPHVPVYENGITKYVSITGIRYVEVIGHNIIYHMTDSDSEKRGALKSELKLFTENGFAQCNKSCLINLRFVLGINGYTLHLAKARGQLEYDEISIGHPRKKEFMHALNKFLEENL